MTYYFSDNVIGAATDITALTTTAPGITGLPSVTYEPQLGEIRKAYDTTLGAAEFIYLKVPASTTLSAGNLVQWTSGYAVASLPVLATSKNTGHQVAVCPAAIASSTSVQYGWFQIQGQATVLKTAVTVSPDSVVYASGTAGRFKVLTSAGGQITGLRTANAATVTSTTSTVTCYLNRPAMQGQVT
jgi:hypothetical protein